MLHARLFAETAKFRDAHFQPLRTSLNFPFPQNFNYFLDGNPKLDRPLFAQFCANNPHELLTAAKYVSQFCDAIDLNLGCPQGIARKGKYGAFLQEDPDLIFSLINTLHEELDIPVTAKIRILDTKEATLAYAQNILRAGASIITIHARTRDMKGHKTGLADWSVIRFLRDNLPNDTVIFANGNILNYEDIELCLNETGADAVMSAEGNLHNPAIFAQPPKIGEEGSEYWRGRDNKGGWRVDAIFRRYLDILYKYVLEVPIPEREPLYSVSELESLVQTTTSTKAGKRVRDITHQKITQDKKRHKRKNAKKYTNPNLLAIQPHLFHLLRHLVSKFHHIRDALAQCNTGDMAAYESVLQMVEEVIKEGLQKYKVTQGESWEEELNQLNQLKNPDGSVLHGQEVTKREGEAKQREEKLRQSENESVNSISPDESSIEMVKACKRPWWVAQPYVRPLPKEALAKGSWAFSKKEKRLSTLQP